MEISIHISATRDGSEAYNAITYEPSNLTIAMDQIPNRLNFEAIQRIQSAVSDSGGEWKINTFSSLIAEEQRGYLPDSMLRRIVFSVRSSGKFYIPVASEEPPQAESAFIAGIDAQGHVLATGLATRYLPQ